MSGAVIVAGGALAGATLAACSGGDGGTEVVRRDAAGVEIVESPEADRTLDWTFERVSTLGGEMEGPASFTSVNAATVDTDELDVERLVVYRVEREGP